MAEIETKSLSTRSIIDARAAAALTQQSFESVFGVDAGRSDREAAGVKLGEHRVFVVPDDAFQALERAINHGADAARQLLLAYADGTEEDGRAQDVPSTVRVQARTILLQVNDFPVGCGRRGFCP
jgi:hypothetical protein